MNKKTILQALAKTKSDLLNQMDYQHTYIKIRPDHPDYYEEIEEKLFLVKIIELLENTINSIDNTDSGIPPIKRTKKRALKS